MIITIIFSFYFIFYSQDVFGRGAFQVRLKYIVNIDGTVMNQSLKSIRYNIHGRVVLNQSCCDGNRKMHSRKCEEECDTFFRICLKQYEDVVSTSGPCTFGSATTPVLGGNSFQIPVETVSADGRKFSNPIVLPFTFSWMVSF